MAKVVITIEDAPGGMLKIESNPTFETMMKMDTSGSEDITGARGCALKVLYEIYKGSRSKKPSTIYVPKIRGGF